MTRFKRTPMSILLVILSLKLACAQNPEPSVICIIGTSHTSTGFCNVQVLDSVLNRVKPDLILVELDSSFFTSDFQFDTVKRPYMLKEGHASPEDIASNNYRKSHKASMRPFDITGRNDFYRENDFFNRQDSMYKDIARYGLGGQLSERNQSDFSLLCKSLENVNDLEITTLRELNSEMLMNFLEIQEFIYLNKPLEIVETTDSLKKHAGFAHLQKDFWEKRNDTMIKNILHFTNEYRRIVVLTGNLHRYYLVKGLNRVKGNFVIRDFWTF